MMVEPIFLYFYYFMYHVDSDGRPLGAEVVVYRRILARAANTLEQDKEVYLPDHEGTIDALGVITSPWPAVLVEY